MQVATFPKHFVMMGQIVKKHGNSFSISTMSAAAILNFNDNPYKRVLNWRHNIYTQFRYDRSNSEMAIVFPRRRQLPSWKVHVRLSRYHEK